MNTDFKNIIWAKIAEEMETTGKKYNNIIIQYNIIK